MIAGSLAQLDSPTDDPLESWAHSSDLPALQVEQTQSGLGDHRPIQAGTAATQTQTKQLDVGVNNPRGGSVTIETSRVPTSQRLATEWVADPTGSGLIAAETTDGDDRLAFPFDLFYSRTGERVDRLTIDIPRLHRAWDQDGVLGDVWMEGVDDANATNINYHDAAGNGPTPTIGLGFERPWQGTVMRGVAYESGYVAIYNVTAPSKFVRFLDEELLPYADPADGDEFQARLDQQGGEASGE